jgi:hypothetical protein
MIAAGWKEEEKFFQCRMPKEKENVAVLIFAWLSCSENKISKTAFSQNSVCIRCLTDIKGQM